MRRNRSIHQPHGSTWPDAASVKISRRALLAGIGGSVAAAGTGFAASGLEADLAIEEYPDRLVVKFRNAHCIHPVAFTIPRIYWSPSTDAVAAGADLRLTDRSHPPAPDGEARREIAIDISRAQFAGTPPFRAQFRLRLLGFDCVIGLTTTGWPRQGETEFGAVDLIDFVQGRGLAASLSKGEATRLVGAFFGTRLAYSPAGSSRLSLGPDLKWRLSGGPHDRFTIEPRLDPTAPASPVSFPSLVFAPSPPGGGPFDSDTIARAFFAGNQADAPVSAASPAALCGTSDGEPVGPTSIGLGHLDGDRVEMVGMRVANVALQILAGMPDVLSGVTCASAVVNVNPGPHVEGPFIVADGSIVRYGPGGGLGLARLPIAAKASEISTKHGRFIVESADPRTPSPGEASLRPGMELSTRDGALQSFAVSTLLRQALLPFPARATGATTSGSFFHRLDFAGAACSFVLDRLPTAVPWSAGSVIRIGTQANGDAATAAKARVRLDQAKLRVVRPDDLLSLAFTFSGLALERLDTGWDVAALAEGQCDVHLAEPINALRRDGVDTAGAFRAGASLDSRPILVVEFPPQHVAERAYLRQIDDGEDPPDVVLADRELVEVRDALATLDAHRQGRDVDVEARLIARRQLQCVKLARADDLSNQASQDLSAAECARDTAQKALDTAKAAKADADKLAGLQTDLSARSAAVSKATEAASVVAGAREALKRFIALFEARIDEESLAARWPEDQKIYAGSEWLDPDVRRFARRLAAEPTAANGKKDLAGYGQLPSADPGDPDYEAWVAAYDKWGERLFGGLPRYCGPEGVRALIAANQLSNVQLAALLAQIDCEIGGHEQFERTGTPTPARLSGPTRLAFRINCDDVEGGDRFPFTLEALTDWSRYDLSVIRRAEKLLDFDRSGRLPPRWGRRENLDAAAILAHQGIRPAFGPEALLHGGRGLAAQRMAEVVAAVSAEPQAFETAIELPFRLTLSPAQDARWLTPRLAPSSLRPVPLWQAVLDDDSATSTMRAVWSEDFRPEVFATGRAPPPHGPWAPWGAPTVGDAGGPFHAAARFRASMDAGDRHELVALTSMFGLPALGRGKTSTSTGGEGDQVEPPPGYGLRDLMGTGDAIYMPRPLSVSELALSALGGSLTLDTHFEPPASPMGLDNRPFYQALGVEQWRHTAVLGRDISVQVVYKGFLFPIGHRVSYVKTTERRFMQHPDGGPVAYLIQRLYLQIGQPRKIFPALGQADGGRCFPPRLVNILTRRTPDLVDPQDRAPARWGPDSKPIPAGAGPVYATEFANGAVALSDDQQTTLPGLVFWPSTSTNAEATVRFEMQFDDAGGSVKMPLLFLDNAAAHDQRTVRAVVAYYNNHERTPRSVDHNGVPRRYAQESKAGEATFETLQWTLLAEGGPGVPDNADYAPSSPLEGADQPPFYPKLETCRIRVNQVGKFTGGPAPEVTARYYKDYVKFGFDADGRHENAAGAFLLVDKDDKLQDLPALRFGASGDRASGLGRPEHKLGALGTKGPIGTSKPFENAERTAASFAVTGDAAPSSDSPFSNFDPKAFFGKFGKLLGILDLGEVIRVVAGLAGQPQLAETIDYISDQAWTLVCQTILEPIRDLLSKLDQTWHGAVAIVSVDAAQQIEALFKDLVDARAQLAIAVDTALGSEQPSLDVQARLIGAVYEKARVFINALQRLGADPLGEVQVEIRDRIHGLVRDFLAIKADTVDGLFALVATTEQAAISVVGTLADQLFDFSWLPVEQLDLQAPDLETVAAVLRAPLSSTDLIAAYNTAKTLDGAAKHLLQARLSEAKAALPSPVDRKKLDDAADRLTEAGTTLVYQALAGPLDKLLAARNAVTADLQNVARRVDPQAMLDLIAGLGSVLLSLANAIRALPAFVAAECSAVIDLAVDVTKAFGMTDNSLKPVETLADCLASPDKCVPVKDKSAVDQILTGLRDLTSPAGTPLNAWIKEFRQANDQHLAQLARGLMGLEGHGMPEDEATQVVNDCNVGNFQAVAVSIGKMSDLLHRRAAVAGTTMALITDTLHRLGNLPPPSPAGKADDKRVMTAVLQLLDGLLRLFADTDARLVVADIRKLGYAAPDIAAFLDVASNIEKFIGDLSGSNPDLQKARRDVDRYLNSVAVGAVEQARQILPQLFHAADEIAFKTEFQAWTILLKLAPLLDAALLLLEDIYEAAGIAAAQGKAVITDTFAEIDKSYVLALALNGLKERLIGNLTKVVAGAEKSDVVAARSALNDLKAVEPDPGKFEDARKKIAKVAEDITSPNNAIVLLARDLGDLLKAILRGDIGKLIDVDAPRREIEALIRDLIPHKATLNYRLDTELQPFQDIFIPDEERGDRKLTIDTTAVVDLLNGDQPPKTIVQGTLDPFNIHLFGSSFDIVTLKFKRATFGSTPDSPFRFGIEIETVELGEMVEFLKALQAYLTPADGNGFYLRPAAGSPGIEVGYGLNLGTISLGPVSFINVSLNAGCRLPFDDKSALFTISLSRPEAPFLISAGIYGGGGYLGLIADGKSIVGFEASFEFGGVAAFSFGPLTGIGRLTTGIYLRKLYQYTTLEGFFFCGGSARIACFGISASLSVRISMQPGGAMTGSAIFSFSFSIGFAHLDFHVTVFKTQSKLGSQSTMRSTRSPVMLALATASDMDAIPRVTDAPRIYAATLSPDRDWTVYRSYFDLDLMDGEDMP